MGKLKDEYELVGMPDADPEPLIMAAMVHLHRTLAREGKVVLTLAECTAYQHASGGIQFAMGDNAEIVLTPIKARTDA